MIWDQFLSEADRRKLGQIGRTGPDGLGQRPAIMVIDVSWGFAGDEPGEDILASIKRWPNSCGAESWQAIERIQILCDAARAQGVPIIYTTGQARADAWDIGSWAWKNSRTREQVPVSVQERDANEIVAPLAPTSSDAVIYKRKPSAFFGAPTATHLRRLGCDSVLLTGTTTSGCVRASAVDAFSHGFKVAAVSDGCFDRVQASHALALFDIAMRYGTVLDTQAGISHLNGLADQRTAG
ncbi:isochorismatase family protein [Pseudohoeflea coraliihabitans]|uniref:Isochorismatase family protein n=1 Tax=Pseudohoeflea coraliihabitans TaxID=2860393 RepID=A0ABS6WMS5_9HYPH|nr:isochorismatase family protein [Pseudohoeflea sp. DP4N28-3]MBW3097253.1 isochorismatase family protein [Pseudohoeflea sp. DP4N28-3]